MQAVARIESAHLRVHARVGTSISAPDSASTRSSGAAVVGDVERTAKHRPKTAGSTAKDRAAAPCGILDAMGVDLHATDRADASGIALRSRERCAKNVSVSTRSNPG